MLLDALKVLLDVIIALVKLSDLDRALNISKSDKNTEFYLSTCRNVSGRPCDRNDPKGCRRQFCRIAQPRFLRTNFLRLSLKACVVPMDGVAHIVHPSTRPSDGPRPGCILSGQLDPCPRRSHHSENAFLPFSTYIVNKISDNMKRGD